MGKKIAILTGVSQYEHETSLPPCENDLRMVADIIKGTSKYDDYVVIGKSPKAGCAKKEIESFIKTHKNQKIEEVFFYYTGHGTRYSGDFLFVFSDFDKNKIEKTSLCNSELDSMLRSLSPDLAVKVVDACQAGTEYIKSSDDLENIFRKSASSNFNKTYFFFSCTSSEGAIAVKDYSLFTKSFTNAIVAYSGKTIRYRDLMAYISDDETVTSRQTPLFIQQAHNTEIFCHVSEDLIKAIKNPIKQQENEVRVNVGQRPVTPGGTNHSVLSVSGTVYCTQCGQSPGSYSTCIGAKAHNFLSVSGTVYCTQCGHSPGSYSTCIGAKAHNFLSFEGNLFYCTQCGQSPGSYSTCIGAKAHNFLSFEGNLVYCTQCGQSPGSYSTCIGAKAHDFKKL